MRHTIYILRSVPYCFYRSLVLSYRIIAYRFVPYRTLVSLMTVLLHLVDPSNDVFCTYRTYRTLSFLPYRSLVSLMTVLLMTALLHLVDASHDVVRTVSYPIVSYRFVPYRTMVSLMTVLLYLRTVTGLFVPYRIVSYHLFPYRDLVSFMMALFDVCCPYRIVRFYCIVTFCTTLQGDDVGDGAVPSRRSFTWFILFVPYRTVSYCINDGDVPSRATSILFAPFAFSSPHRLLCRSRYRLRSLRRIDFVITKEERSVREYYCFWLIVVMQCIASHCIASHRIEFAFLELAINESIRWFER